MKSKNTWLVILAFLMASIGFFGNNNQEVQAAKSNGVLRIGLEANYPPYNWTQTVAMAQFQLKVQRPMLMVTMFKSLS